ncbi:sigma-E factor negative regulatory protein [Rhodoferax sp.]|uniref:sigma-E factor negative regulatory protein n=1 Tax=Rhodoferax sp. TaxID=50421 RepID=UPI002609D902|nr:sigma-E factor negative regulatory protein [Rhodoferax sp.]MDD2924190.1 sigma-E factor negative regulatory protein [Rhodoferax sp.]
MSDKLQPNAELVSALLDGELHGQEFVRAVDYLGDSEAAQADWDTYHLVGELMRAPSTPAQSHDPVFLQRLRREINSFAIESIANEAYGKRDEGQNRSQEPAANDAWWRRVAGLASVALVGVLAWQGYVLLAADGVTGSGAQLAQRPVQPLVETAQLAQGDASAVMIRDPQLDALLAAHRQLGGATALQTPSGFLRNATFNEGGR